MEYDAAITLQELSSKLDALVKAIENLGPKPQVALDFDSADCFVFDAQAANLVPVHHVNRVDVSLIKGVDLMRDQLLENTQRFASGLPANNVLLWGARGMGKSSLVKATHAAITQHAKSAARLKLIEIHREDIDALPRLMSRLRESVHRFILFCDDLSFDHDDTSYKSLKAALDGGVEGRPSNVIFYATSNRRHLLPRDMMDNERAAAINQTEAIEEKVSLSDRFGLWLGFHKCSQDEYLDMINGYVAYHKLEIDAAELRRDALEWSTTRGGRSGRVAWQYITDLAGRLGVQLKVGMPSVGLKPIGHDIVFA
ncbi:MAG: ATP-binding protein [Ahrensia sp.]|nr:ATP-binding protein [Ahrensia sp.]